MEEKKRTDVRPTDQDTEIGRFLSGQANRTAGDAMHLTPEEIAALLDGRTSGDERERAMGHLADCGECYPVYRSALLSRSELERHPSSRLRRALTLGFPLAAAAVVLLVVVVQFREKSAQEGTTIVLHQPVIEQLPRQGAAELAALLQGSTEAALLAGADLAGERAVYGYASALTKEQRAFRLGTALSHFAFAISKADRARALADLDDVRRLLADQPHFAEAAAIHGETRKAVERDGERSVATVEAEERLLLPVLGRENTLSIYRLGVWVEAVRIVSESGTKGKNETLTRFLHKIDRGRPALQELKSGNVPADIVRSVESIAAFVGVRTITQWEFAVIHDEARAIIDEMR